VFVTHGGALQRDLVGRIQKQPAAGRGCGFLRGVETSTHTSQTAETLPAPKNCISYRLVNQVFRVTEECVAVGG
jgi:hypothetical protein